MSESTPWNCNETATTGRHDTAHCRRHNEACCRDPVYSLRSRSSSCSRAHKGELCNGGIMKVRS
jgi:hypothetical protein